VHVHCPRSVRVGVRPGNGGQGCRRAAVGTQCRRSANMRWPSGVMLIIFVRMKINDSYCKRRGANAPVLRYGLEFHLLHHRSSSVSSLHLAIDCIHVDRNPHPRRRQGDGRWWASGKRSDGGGRQIRSAANGRLVPGRRSSGDGEATIILPTCYQQCSGHYLG
jgi:hypothetical protein